MNATNVTFHLLGRYNQQSGSYSITGKFTQIAATSKFVSKTINIIFNPDCSKYETLTLPSSPYAGFLYQIIGGSQEFLLSNVTSSNVNCSVVYSYYSTNTTMTIGNSRIGIGSGIGDGLPQTDILLKYDNNKNSFQVDSNSNQYGDTVYQIKVTASFNLGTNPQQNTKNYEFPMKIIKQCQPATFQSAQNYTANPSSYTIYSSSKDLVYYQTPVSDPYCQNNIRYQFFVNDNDNFTYGYAECTSSICSPIGKPFTIQLNTLSQNKLTFNYNSLSDNSLLGFNNIETRNFTITQVATLCNSTHDFNSKSFSINFQINSACQNSLINVAGQTLNGATQTIASSNVFVSNYYIRTAVKSLTFSSVFSVDQTYIPICGNLQYAFYTNSSDTIPSLFVNNQTFTSDNTTQILKLYSDSIPLFAPGNMTYNLYLMAQLGKHYKSRGILNIQIQFIDDCYSSQIINPTALVNQSYMRAAQSTYQSYQFYDNCVNKTYQIGSGDARPSNFSCGSIIYKVYWLNHISTSNYSIVEYVPIENITGQIVKFTSPNASNNFLVFDTYVPLKEQEGYYEFIIMSTYNLSSTIYKGTNDSLAIQIGECVINQINAQVNDSVYMIRNGLQQFQIAYTTFTQTPKCNYIFRYSTQLSDDTGLPSSIQFINSTLNDKSMYYAVLINDIGIQNNIINIDLIIDVYDESKGLSIWKNKTKRTWALQLLYMPYNDPPYYSTKLNYFTVYLDKKREISTGPASIDTIKATVTVDNNNFFEFCTYQIDPKTFEVIFQINPTQIKFLGLYTITIKLIDDDLPASKYTLYSFIVAIKQPEGYVVDYLTNTTKQDHVKQVSTTKPKCIISEISQFQKFILTCDQPMNFEPKGLPKLTDLNFEQLQKTIFVQTKSGTADQQKIQIIEFKCESYTDRVLNFELKFQDPNYVSKGEAKDFLQLDFLNMNYFYSKENNETMQESSIEQKKPIPCQMVDNSGFFASSAAMKASMQSLDPKQFLKNLVYQGSLNYFWGQINTFQITIHLYAINVQTPVNVNLINSILMGISQFEIIPPEGLNYFYFWRIFDGTYLGKDPCLGDDNLVSVMDTLSKKDDAPDEGRKLAESGFVELEFLNETRFDPDDVLETKVSIDQQQTQLIAAGYGSKYLINNFGTLFALSMIFMVFFILFMCYKCIFRKCIEKTKCCKAFVDKVDHSLFWGVFIGFSLDNYMEFSIISQYNVNKGDFQQLQGSWSIKSTKGDGSSVMHENVSLVSSCIALAFVIILPFVIMCFLTYNQKSIVEEKRAYYEQRKSDRYMPSEMYSYKFPIKRKYGVITEEVKKDKGFLALNYYPIFMIRRLLLAIILVQLQKRPVLQIQFNIFLTTIMIIYVAKIRPFEENFTNKLQLFNECLNMILSYHFFIFTDWLPDKGLQLNIGYIYISGMVVLVLTNMSFMFLGFIQQFIACCRRKQKQGRYEQNMKSIKELILMRKEEIEISRNAPITEETPVFEVLMNRNYRHAQYQQIRSMFINNQPPPEPINLRSQLTLSPSRQQLLNEQERDRLIKEKKLVPMIAQQVYHTDNQGYNRISQMIEKSIEQQRIAKILQEKKQKKHLNGGYRSHRLLVSRTAIKDKKEAKEQVKIKKAQIKAQLDLSEVQEDTLENSHEQVLDEPIMEISPLPQDMKIEDQEDYEIEVETKFTQRLKKAYKNIVPKTVIVNPLQITLPRAQELVELKDSFEVEPQNQSDPVDLDDGSWELPKQKKVTKMPEEIKKENQNDHKKETKFTQRSIETYKNIVPKTDIVNTLQITLPRAQELVELKDSFKVNPLKQSDPIDLDDGSWELPKKKK